MGSHSHIFVARKHAVALESSIGNLHEAGLQVKVDIGFFSLGDGSVKRRKLIIVDVVVGVFNSHLDGDAEVDVGVHGTNRQGKVEDIGAGAEARVEGREEELAVGSGQVERNIESGVAADVVLAGLSVSLGIIRLRCLSLVPESTVIARVPSRGRSLILPRELGIRSHGDRCSGGVSERWGALVLDARTQVRELCHGSAAEESGCVELSADRVDLGRSNILGGRAELEVDLQVGAAGVEEVSREHNSTGLRSGSGELTLLGREEVLADGLCLGETIALVLGADIKGGVLGHGGENLDHVEAIKGQSSALLLTVLGSHGTDAIFDVSHVRRLVVALPETHGWGELEVVVPDTLMLHGVVACAEGKLVGNNKVEGDCICASSLEDTIAGEVCRAERHAELHERTRSVVGAGILADKVNTGIGSASEEDLKAIISNIALGVDDDVSCDLGARSIRL